MSWDDSVSHWLLCVLMCPLSLQQTWAVGKLYSGKLEVETDLEQMEGST